MKTLMNQILPITMVICATVLIMHDKTGWGWLLIIAFLSGSFDIYSNNTNRTHTGGK